MTQLFLHANEKTIKPFVDDEQQGPVYAMSNSRRKWTQRIVGQAAWGIPLDSWATICGWNFARRNVKVELTKTPTWKSAPCKTCFKVTKGSAMVPKEPESGRTN